MYFHTILGSDLQIRHFLGRNEEGGIRNKEVCGSIRAVGDKQRINNR